MLDALPNTVEALWNTFQSGSSTIATKGTGQGNYLAGELIDYLFDDDLTTKYGSRGNSTSGNNAYAGLNTGFYVTVAQCQPVLIGFRFGNAFSSSAREPLTITIEGTNCDDLLTCANWSLLYTGSTGLGTIQSSASYGDYQSVSNTAIYSSYRFLVISKRGVSSYVSYSEVQLFGYTNYTAGSSSGSSSEWRYLLVH